MERQRAPFRHYFGALLPTDQNARLLDVGCGYGAFLYYLQKEGYNNAEGVDISPEQIEAARRLGVSNVMCSDVVAFLQGRTEAYDCITAIDFVDHVPKEQILPLLKAIHNALRPGGSFLMQAVNGGSPFAARLRYADFTHEFALTALSARQILEAAGFTSVQTFGTDPYVHGLRSLVRVMIWKALTALLGVYLAAETGVLRGHILTQNLISTAVKSGTGSM